MMRVDHEIATILTPQLMPELAARGGLRVRLASSDGVRNAASTLVRARYAWRRYACPASEERPDAVTLVAGGVDDVVGTLTLTLDGPRGLLCSAAFPDVVETLRAQTAHLCEISRFAVQTSRASPHVIGALFHIAYLYGRHLNGATAAIMECNPRHVEAHRRMLGFEPVSEVRVCDRAGAPAVLMYVPRETIEQGIDLWAGKGDAPRHTAFRHFFPRHEEAGILARIRDGVG